MGASNWIYLENCKIIRTTEWAILLYCDMFEKDEWFPKSGIEDQGKSLSAGDENVTVAITEWIAKKKGIEI